jgi:cell division septation protein DedD
MLHMQKAWAVSGWVGVVMILTLLLAGCAQQSGGPASSAGTAPSYAPTQYYPPPGPPDDPWGPYIVEAAARFQIPQQWIRAVMQQESGGEEQAVSDVGAMGLMQLMPETYQDLQAQYGLGEDPFDPHNNILAGAAYIREMYDRYGAPGFLAAYNAGPADVDAYLAGNASLPDETVNYLAMVTPNLGTEIAFSGPFANYETGGSAGQAAPTLADFASGCDVNAAYDPDHPCTATAQTGVIQGQPTITASANAGTCDADNAYDPDDPCTPSAQGTGSGSCDTDTAYDPDSPCTPAQVQTAQAEAAPSAETPDCGSSLVFNPACPASVIASVEKAPAASQPASETSSNSSGNWAIQVGAFANADLARSIAQNARNEISALIGNADISLAPTTPFGGSILYQARLTHLSAQAAVQACSALNRQQLPCVVVQPSSA